MGRKNGVPEQLIQRNIHHTAIDQLYGYGSPLVQQAPEYYIGVALYEKQLIYKWYVDENGDTQPEVIVRPHEYEYDCGHYEQPEIKGYL